MRCFTRHAQLWTEMTTDGAILHNADKLQTNLSKGIEWNSSSA